MPEWRAWHRMGANWPLTYLPGGFMFRPFRFGFALILTLALTALPALAAAPISKPKAKNPPPPPLVPMHKPIVAKWTTVQGMRYYHDGFLLDEGKGPTLDSVIYSMNDAQASALLHKSENDESLGLFSYVGGGALFIGGLLSTNYNEQTRQWNVSTGSVVVMGLGTVVEFVGRLLISESITSKFAAVQRYNQVVRGEDDPSVENWKAVPPADLSVAFSF